MRGGSFHYEMAAMFRSPAFRVRRAHPYRGWWLRPARIRNHSGTTSAHHRDHSRKKDCGAAQRYSDQGGDPVDCGPFAYTPPVRRWEYPLYTLLFSLVVLAGIALITILILQIAPP
jgi:hypothetical protein